MNGKRRAFELPHPAAPLAPVDGRSADQSRFAIAEMGDAFRGRALSIGWARPPLVGDDARGIGSLGAPRATGAPMRQSGDRAAASSWETDGGSGT